MFAELSRTRKVNRLANRKWEREKGIKEMIYVETVV